MCENCEKIRDKAAKIAAELGRIAIKTATGVDPVEAMHQNISQSISGEQKAEIMEGLTVAFTAMGKAFDMPPEIMVMAILTSISNAFPDQIGMHAMSPSMGASETPQFGFVPQKKPTLH